MSKKNHSNISKKSNSVNENNKLNEKIDSLKRESDLWMITSFVLGLLLIISIFTSGFEFQESEIEDINNTLENLKSNYNNQNIVYEIIEIQNRLKILSEKSSSSFSNNSSN
ncbi:MAG: hypothetical protein ACOCRX_04540 [Candidatus Woesearchaeota archaeon]